MFLLIFAVFRNQKIAKHFFLYDDVKMKEQKVTKTVKLDLALNAAVEAASKRLGEDQSTIIRMAIRAGLPIIERHHEAMTKSSAQPERATTAPARRMEEVPKKSSAQ